MIYKETVSEELWVQLQKLMKDELLKEFVLVGGTALSLKIGHRESIDIDLFTNKDFNVENLVIHLQNNYNAILKRYTKNSINAYVEKVKVDIIAHKYPLLKPIEDIMGIRMVSNEDIGAMKLHAIVQSGSRIKDFIDMYFLLEHHPLKTYLDAYEQKYEGNAKLAGNALLYHKNIASSQMVKILNGNERNWNSMKDRLREAVFEPTKNFTETRLTNTREITQKKNTKGFRR
ncbi:nucleotidyl transferase AbiEii/AbiGii toxin family protein [Flavobacterium supellecticarium]|uniref:Nucleotidyl transferase AbiEii/AbiGii toxin family protein n=1 Tax=Flavobacterium supellecticarium TaxID=2565924 RepID=A0A4S4A3X5_9FLAO|nr:nucleotidyl transferase AbiEii/AbiGii toxin family protein [Flavobacterium supellecticarium]THF53141.1 nucleotidyl transferase AbiEii/AbiGii toxin family protein [Flavobacterium supellecticarium]